MPGTRVAPSSSSAKPRPPAAPAPLPSAVFLSVASASRSSSASTACRRSSATPFCGPKTLMAPRSPSSGLSTSVAATSSHPGDPRPGRRPGRRSPGRRARRRRRPGRPPAWRSRPSAASRPAPPSLVPEPPSPTTTRVAPASQAARDQLADAVGAGLLGPSLLARREVQAARLGALDVRRAVVHQHGARHRLAVRAADGHRQQVTAQRGVQDVDEAGAAVRHRDQLELVVGGLAPPALGDRLGRLDGAQGAGELVGSDQHAHESHPT